MLNIVTFLCVVLLVRAHGKEQKKEDLKELLKGPDHDHGLKQHVTQLRSIVNDLAIGVAEESNAIVQSDLKDLLRVLKEIDVKVEHKQEELPKEKSADENRKKVLQDTTLVALQEARDKVVIIALEAAKHCRGEGDIVLGKILEDESKSKREAKEGCLADNPHTENLMNAFGELETLMLTRLEVIVDNIVNKLTALLENAVDFDFNGAAMYDDNRVREIAQVKTQEAVKTIDALLPIIVESAKKLDAEKHQDQVVEKIQVLIRNRDQKGNSKVLKALMSVIRDVESKYHDIEEAVSKK